MASSVLLRGAFPVLPTIFDAAGRIDLAGFENVVDFVIGCGVDGVVFPGLASEYDHLSFDERCTLIKVVGQLSAGKCHFVVGASDTDPGVTRQLMERGAATGAAAAMILTPRCFAGDTVALARFFGSLAETSPLAVMLQNAPQPMGLGLKAAEVAAIIENSPSVQYIKEETQPCGQRIAALQSLMPPHVNGIFGGAGGRYILDELARGAVGTMPAAELTELHVALVAANRAGDAERARTLYERMLPILTMQAVFRWSLTKEVLHRRGLIGDVFVRADGPRLDRHDRVELSTMLARLADLIGEMKDTKALTTEPAS